MIGRPGRLLTVDGRSRTVSAWSKITGVSVNNIRHRLREGMSPAEAILPAKDTISSVYVLRNLKISRLADEGLSDAEIGKMVGLSRGRVAQILGPKFTRRVVDDNA